MHELVGEAALVAGGVVTIGTAVGLAWKKVIRPLSHIIVKIEQTIPLIDDIRLQFENNGGSTLKDAVDRIEHNARNTRQAVDLHVAQSDQQRKTLFKRVGLLEQSLSDLTGLVNTLIGLNTPNGSSANGPQLPTQGDRGRTEDEGGTL